MSYLRDQVIVLKKAPLREWDRQYILYGREHGLLIATARGAMKANAKQAGHLEPFTFADVMIAKGRAYDHLAVASRARQNHRLKHLGAFLVAGSFADLCLKLLHPGVSDARIYELWEELIDVLAALPQEPSAIRAQLVFAAASLRLLDLLGYGPIFRVCASCENVPGPTDVFYAPKHNHLICQDCIKDHPGANLRIQAYALNTLNFIRQAPLADVLRLTANTEILLTVVLLTKEISKHAPLNFEPHGFRSIPELIV